MQTIAEDLDAAALWSRYLASGDEGAFATLVLSHIDLVHGVARRLLPDQPHLADDVTQTVFCDLARKAGEIPVGVNLPGWLHRHTCFTARKMLRGEFRRDRREHAAAMNPIPDEPSADALWLGVRPLLDEALLELEEPDRQALLLRFLQGKPFKTLALAFAVSEDAARMRVGRALNRLRDVLERKGVTTTADALGHSLAAHAALAAPMALAGWVTAAAMSASAATTTAVVAGLTLKKAVAIAAAAAVVVSGVLLVQQKRNEIRGLRDEVWTLRPLQEQVRQLEERNNRLAGQLPGADEVAAARKLLDEVTKLRGRLTAAETAQSNALAEVAAALAATNGMVGFVQGELPIKTFSAYTQKTITPGQTLLMGGWEMSLGKRTYALLTVEVNKWGQIESQAKFVEGTAVGMDAVGLRPAKGSEWKYVVSEVMDSDQTKKLFADMGQNGGTDVLAAPGMTTANGRQAQIAIHDRIQVGGETFQTGPSLEFVPTISADGKSIDLRVMTVISIANTKTEPVPEKP
jgi:RNA polymerase sigma factor (sigma-70 family)